MKIAGRILALQFAAVLFGLAIVNLPLTLSALEEGKAADQELADVSEALRNAYLSDEFWQKNQFININGLYARLTGRRELNETVLMRNGMLGYPGDSSRSMNLPISGVTQLANWVQAIGKDFLFVQMPFKLDMAGEMLPLGYEDHLHANADTMLAMLAEKNVPTLDLRPELCATMEQVDQYFYSTDHHWSARGALKGFQLVLDRLQEMYPEKNILGSEAVDASNWQEHVIRNYHLGSHGKRVGQLYAGVDDLMWYTPLFDTRMSMYVPKYQSFTAGSFEDAVIARYYVEGPAEYFDESPYNLYVGGDYPLVMHRNGKAPVDLKLLIIKDSFTIPMQCFLSTVFTSVEAIDPRHYTEQSIADYIRQSDPDLVMLAVNPSLIDLQDYYSFETPDPHEIYEMTTVFSDSLRLPAEDDSYNFEGIPAALEPNTLYHVQLDSLTVTEGETAGVHLMLYSPENDEFLSSYVIDTDYYAKTGEASWYFRTTDASDAELHICSGIHGSTNGIGIACKNVTLSKVTTSYPEGYTPQSKTIISAMDIALSPRDDAYNFEALSTELEDDAEYTLTLEGVRLDAGETSNVQLTLYDSSADEHLTKQTVAVESAGGSSLTWTFRTPAEHEGPLSVLLYAGMPGKTNYVGVTYRSLTLVKNLIPSTEPTGNQPDSADAPALPRNLSFTITPSGSYYHFDSFPLSLNPGATYTLTIDSIELTEGATDAMDITLYLPEQDIHLAEVQFSLAQQDYRWTFRAPEGSQACQLLVYTGVRGATNNIGLTVNGLTLTHTAEAPDGNIVFLQDVVIEPSEEDYHYETLEIAFEPNTAYRLTVDEVIFQDGTSEVLSISLYDLTNMTHLCRSDLPLVTDGTSPACTWEFETPEGDSSAWRLLVYAGDRSSTPGVGIECRSLMVVQAEDELPDESPTR